MIRLLSVPFFASEYSNHICRKPETAEIGTSMKQIILIVIIVIVGLFLFKTSTLVWRFYQGTRFASQSVRFEAKDSDARARILVVGDSTGVGTGASRPSDSIAGRLYRDFPHSEVVNRSRNGARVEDVMRQLNHDDDKGFDIVLVQVGGNDILRFSNLNRLRGTIGEVLEEAGERGQHVIFISTGNVGLAPAFFPPFNWIYTERTRKVRAVFMEAGAHAGVEYVDLFKERDEDPFLRDPNLYYAADYLHPGSEGYRLWYEELKRQTSLTSILRSKGGE
jgi:lysophospholipase L1-like esterase